MLNCFYSPSASKVLCQWAYGKCHVDATWGASMLPWFNIISTPSLDIAELDIYLMPRGLKVDYTQLYAPLEWEVYNHGARIQGEPEDIGSFSTNDTQLFLQPESMASSKHFWQTWIEVKKTKW